MLNLLITSMEKSGIKFDDSGEDRNQAHNWTQAVFKGEQAWKDYISKAHNEETFNRSFKRAKVILKIGFVNK